MKKSAILKILDEIETNSSVKRSEEYKNSFSAFMTLDKEMQKKLRAYPELFELYDKINDAIVAMNCASNNDYFVEGFKNGLLTGIETALE